MATAQLESPLLECQSVGKSFGGEMALAEIDWALAPGEIHGLVGSNGAGKSTLMKILSGALPDHAGQVRVAGQPAALASPQAALALGIAMVYQELSGVGQLSVAENICLGRQPTRRGRIDWPTMRRQAREQLAELEIELDVTRRLDRFPLAIRQLVEIARGLHSGARLLILDEPTSALSPPETRRLFALMKRLRDRGVAQVFISHFIEDVLEVCDRVTILKDGRLVSTHAASELDKHAVIHAMLGHSLSTAEAGYESAARLPAKSSAAPRLVARSLTKRSVFSQVSLEVAPGECLGLYGFVGAGHQELAHALAGALPVDGGDVRIEGAPLTPGDTTQAIRRGVVLVAADRKQTLVGQAEIYKNATLAHLRTAVGEWLSAAKESAVTVPLLWRVGCRPAAPRLQARHLSGGNQQKVVLAKWLLGAVRVLVLDEPTRGMDVGAKDEILRLVAELRREGAAVILASSEPELVLAHADRIAVVRRGQIVHEFVDTEVDKATLMKYA